MAQIYAGDIITASGLTGSYVSAFTRPPSAIKRLLILNGADKDIVVKVDDEELYIPVGLSLNIGDLNGTFRFQPTAQVKHAGVAPTAGKVQLVGFAC